MTDQDAGKETDRGADKQKRDVKDTESGITLKSDLPSAIRDTDLGIDRH